MIHPDKILLIYVSKADPMNSMELQCLMHCLFLGSCLSGCLLDSNYNQWLMLLDSANKIRCTAETKPQGPLLHCVLQSVRSCWANEFIGKFLVTDIFHSTCIGVVLNLSKLFVCTPFVLKAVPVFISFANFRPSAPYLELIATI